MPDNDARTRDAPLRDERGRFLKGQQGCKHGGRRAMPEEFKELAKAHSIEALKVIIEIMNDKSAEHCNRLKAAQMIIERSYGKPETTVQMEAHMLTQGDFTIEILDAENGDED